MSTIKIYTKTGDKGKTSLIGGKRVSKSEVRLDAYGTIDEFNSALGLAWALFAAHPQATALPMAEWVTDMQSRLFDCGSQLACEDEAMRGQLPSINEGQVTALELQIDQMSAVLSELRHFILPGGTPGAAAAHVARTICRRAERLCVRLADEGVTVDDVVAQYLNRASDWCFVLARYMNFVCAEPETIWAPRGD